MSHKSDQPDLEKKRTLLRGLLQERQANPSAQTANSPSLANLPQYTLADMPEIAAFEAQHAEWARHGLLDPCFHAHEGASCATAILGGRVFDNYSSFNYLGLSGHAQVNQAAKDAIERLGTSASASRIAAGERPVHRELEREIASFLGTDEAVVFTAGHATNVSVISHLFGPRDLVIHDELAHNSILAGCLLSGARRLSFAHNDWRDLDRLLRSHRHTVEKALIAVEGVYSVDGDIGDLPNLVAVKDRHAAIMLVDESHSLGVLGTRGAGVAEHFGLARGQVDLWMGTLSKSLAACGGYIAGAARVIRYLKYSAGGFVFSTGMSPPVAAAALAALRLMQEEPWRIERLRNNGKRFVQIARAAGFDTGLSEGTAVVPIMVGTSVDALLLAQAMADRGVHVHAMVPPVVPEGQARLRFFLSACHTEEQMVRTVSVLKEEWDKRGGARQPGLRP